MEDVVQQLRDAGDYASVTVQGQTILADDQRLFVKMGTGR